MSVLSSFVSEDVVTMFGSTFHEGKME